ncbi:unnamed protein product [Caenorhabditis nigoni]
MLPTCISIHASDREPQSFRRMGGEVSSGMSKLTVNCCEVNQEAGRDYGFLSVILARHCAFGLSSVPPAQAAPQRENVQNIEPPQNGSEPLLSLPHARILEDWD